MGLKEAKDDMEEAFAKLGWRPLPARQYMTPPRNP
jgi:hypothetical protein